AAAFEQVPAIADSEKEAAVSRLDHVFGIDAPGQLGGEPAPGHGNQALDVALKQGFGGLLIAAAPSIQQVGRLVVHRASIPFGSRKHPRMPPSYGLPHR